MQVSKTARTAILHKSPRSLAVCFLADCAVVCKEQISMDEWLYRPADLCRAILQADWLSKYPQLVGDLDVASYFNLDEHRVGTIEWNVAEQRHQHAALVLLRSIASKALAPRKLMLNMQQPGDFLTRIGTGQLQSLSLGGVTSLLHVAATLQDLQLPALQQLSVCLATHNDKQQQGQEQPDEEQHLAAAPAAADHPFVAALAAASGLQSLGLHMQLLAAAFSHLPASFRCLTVRKLLGGSSVSHLTQLTHLVLQNPCCDARELVAAVASLPQLQQLQLDYYDGTYPSNVGGGQQEREMLQQVQQHAAVWGGLQQLRDLVVDLQHDYLTEGETTRGQRHCEHC
jgi:hypothetical protein